MERKNTLYLIIGILLIFNIILPLLVIKVDLFFIGLYIDRVRFMKGLSDLVVIAYLLYFIRYIKNQVLSTPVAAGWLLAMLFNTAFSILLQCDLIDFSKGLSNFEAQLRDLFLHSIPGLIIVGCQIFISIQLRKNNAEGKIRDAIRLVGTTLMTTTIILFVSGPLLAFVQADDVILFAYDLLQIIAILPYVAMVYMYWIELKQLNNKI